MDEKKFNIGVNHNIFQGIFRKYLRTTLFLVLTLLLLYFLQGFGTFLVFSLFMSVFIFYLTWRGNWLYEINENGILSGSYQRREQIAWKDLQIIIVELDQEQIYLKSGENSRLVNFQIIPKEEIKLVIEALHHFADRFGIRIEEKRGLKKK